LDNQKNKDKLELIFNNLWEILLKKEGVKANNYYLEYSEEQVFVGLSKNGTCYNRELYIENQVSYSTVTTDIFFYKVEGYDWCLKQLEKIGIFLKDFLGDINV